MWRQIPRVDPDRPSKVAVAGLTDGLNVLNLHLAADLLAKRRIEAAWADLAPDEPLIRMRERLTAFSEFAHSNETYDLRGGDWYESIGRWIFCHGCGGNGGPFAANALFAQGFDTVIFITWFGWQERRFAAVLDLKPGQHLLIIPHPASDSLGMNQIILGLYSGGD